MVWIDGYLRKPSRFGTKVRIAKGTIRDVYVAEVVQQQLLQPVVQKVKDMQSNTRLCEGSKVLGHADLRTTAV